MSDQTATARTLHLLRAETEANLKAALPEIGEDYPDADVLNAEQTAGAIERLREDFTRYPRYPWRPLADVAGPLCPGDLIMIAGRTGFGKSLFLLNLFDALVLSRLRTLYIGLEQEPRILRVKWACMRTDTPPKLVLAPDENTLNSELYLDATERVEADIAWQQTDVMRQTAHFSAARKVNARRLKAMTEWAVDHGCQVIIVDHIDRVEHGDGRNSFHEISETVRLAKELAVEHQVVMLVASQVGRPNDFAEAFTPPALHTLRGGGTKEEESDTVLGVYRPLRANVTDKEIKAVRQGLKQREEILEANIMAVVLLKHRLDGPAGGKIVKLGVKHQRVHELNDRDLWAMAHGTTQ